MYPNPSTKITCIHQQQNLSSFRQGLYLSLTTLTTTCFAVKRRGQTHMLSDAPSNLAELLENMDERVTRLENKDRGDVTIQVSRSIQDETDCSDSLSATTETVSENQFSWGDQWSRKSW